MLALSIPAETLVLIARVVFSAALGLSIALGIILAYHWFRFAMNPIVPLIATAAYSAICAALLMVMLSTLATL